MANTENILEQRLAERAALTAKSKELYQQQTVEENKINSAIMTRYQTLLTTDTPTEDSMKQLKLLQRTLLGPNHITNITVNNRNYNDNSWFGSNGGRTYYGD